MKAGNFLYGGLRWPPTGCGTTRTAPARGSTGSTGRPCAIGRRAEKRIARPSGPHICCGEDHCIRHRTMQLSDASYNAFVRRRYSCVRRRAVLQMQIPGFEVRASLYALSDPQGRHSRVSRLQAFKHGGRLSLSLTSEQSKPRNELQGKK